MKKSLIATLIIGVLLVGGVVSAASGFSWSNVENKVAELIFGSNQSKLDITAPAEGNFLGAGAHSKSTKQIAASSITSGTATTSVYNADSDARIIDKVIFWATSNSSTQGNATVECSYSDDGIYTSTTMASSFGVFGMGGTFYAALASSTWSTTSTFALAHARTWPASTYVICYTAGAKLTAAGMMSVDYYKP